MADKQRALPTWMAAKKEEKVKEKEPLKSRRKRKAVRAAFYCMTENELVEAAVTCLTDAAAREDAALLAGHKVEDEAADLTVKMKESPAPSRTSGELLAEPLEDESSDAGGGGDQETTYVSESDLDVTDMQTLPYAKIPRRQGPGGQGSGPRHDPTDVGLEKKEERTQEQEDDDALRLVREIFFS